MHKIDSFIRRTLLVPMETNLMLSNSSLIYYDYIDPKCSQTLNSGVCPSLPFLDKL
jgi:hypothetical protein